MKLLIALLFTVLSQTAFAANSLVLPIHPAPMGSTHCQQIGNGISCSNGVQCQIQNAGSLKHVQCSNHLSCTQNTTGAVSCNDGSFCQLQGTRLQCHNAKVSCTVVSPTSFFCHL